MKMDVLGGQMHFATLTSNLEEKEFAIKKRLFGRIC